MIKSIKLNNFRGFKEFAISELQRVNLITGKNNCGKSSLLEAVFLFHDHSAPDSSLKIDSFRKNNISFSPEGLWAPLFYQLEMDNTISFEVKDGKQMGRLEYSIDHNNIKHIENGTNSYSSLETHPLVFEYSEGSYKENGSFAFDGAGIRGDFKSNLPNGKIRRMRPTRFINSDIVRKNSEIVEWFSRVELSGKKEGLIKALSIIEPDILDIITAVVAGQPQLHIRTNHGTMPLSYAGDGFYKLMYLILAIMDKKEAVVLIDEIETGLHHSMYRKLWELIDSTSIDHSVQLIITTHSYEIVQAASDYYNSTADNDFSFYRISKNGSTTQAMHYAKDMLSIALDSEMEIR